VACTVEAVVEAAIAGTATSHVVVGVVTRVGATPGVVRTMSTAATTTKNPILRTMKPPMRENQYTLWYAERGEARRAILEFLRRCFSTRYESFGIILFVNRPEDTSLGGRSPAFTSTIWPAIDRLKRGESDPEKEISLLVARYWKPVYACVRIGWKRSNEDAKDLTQEFFLFLIEGGALKAADPTRGRFRTYLKTVLRNFLTGEHRKGTAVKRGGGLKGIAIDTVDAETRFSAPSSADPESVFDLEWARTLVSEALTEVGASLLASGREVHWKVFEAHDLAEGPEGPSYIGVANQFALTEHQVKNILQETRRRIRDSLILKIREYALNEEELWEELQYLMGLWRPR
jgi:RNA polymerase sigma-70 factor (ECF subfamily)